MSPNSPTSLLHLLASTSQQIEFFSSSIVNEVRNGDESPLRVLVQLRAMEKASKAILEGIKEEIITEAEKYPGKDFELWGNKLSKEEVGVSYDYSICGDPTFERLEVDFETAKAKLEERKKFLRTLTEPIPIGDTLTGELVTVRPPKKTSTSSVKVSIR
jgi:hypothetical protein